MQLVCSLCQYAFVFDFTWEIHQHIHQGPLFRWQVWVFFVVHHQSKWFIRIISSCLPDSAVHRPVVRTSDIFQFEIINLFDKEDIVLRTCLLTSLDWSWSLPKKIWEILILSLVVSILCEVHRTEWMPFTRTRCHRMWSLSIASFLKIYDSLRKVPALNLAFCKLHSAKKFLAL